MAEAKQDLVIVESPTKARTLERMLGSEYKVEASFGHIRDLPKSKMGVDLKTFLPEYVVPDDSEKQVRTLRRAAYDPGGCFIRPPAHLVQALRDLAGARRREVAHAARAVAGGRELDQHVRRHPVIRQAFDHALCDLGDGLHLLRIGFLGRCRQRREERGGESGENKMTHDASILK